MARDVDLIKSKLDLVGFLKSYLNLSPAGKNLKAVCPFHQEKTPSFIVSPDKQIWHCFGCGEGGDVIKFAMKYENLEFPEALRFLAEKAGLTIQTLSPQEQKEFGILYDLHEEAKKFYRQELGKNRKAGDYLRSRGLRDETVAEFELGFAPLGETLNMHLLKLGFDVNDISRAGLAHKHASGLYRDRFQERIIFPIWNNVGKTVAFTGRLFRDAGAPPTDLPKYLNSPETPIFNKSKVLYGFNKSKNDVAKERSAVLVEGQMDLLMTWQSGVKNVVAVSGTALTQYHLERLRRLADTVFISFDADDAGIKALERSLEIFSNFDFNLKVIDLGRYKDPADACLADGNFLVEAVKGARPAFAFLFSRYFSEERKPTDVAGKKKVLRHLLQKISFLKSPVERSEWLKALARESGIAETAVIEEFDNLPAASPRGEPADKAEPIAVVKEEISERTDAIANRAVMLAFTNHDFWDILHKNREWLPSLYRSVLDDPQGDLAGQLQMEASFVLANSDKRSVEKEFSGLMRNLELGILKKEEIEIREKIRAAEKRDDEEGVAGMMERFNILSKRINELKY
jgi:DNA primase